MHPPPKRGDAGSTPAMGSPTSPVGAIGQRSRMICDWLEVRVLHRRCVLMPERSKGYDSSSYGENLVGSNPTQHNTSDSGGWECGWYRSRSRVRVRVVPQAGSKWFDSTRCLFITHARVSVIGQRTRLLPGEMQVRILPWAMGAGRGGNTPPRPFHT